MSAIALHAPIAVEIGVEIGRPSGSHQQQAETGRQPALLARPELLEQLEGLLHGHPAGQKQSRDHDDQPWGIGRIVGQHPSQHNAQHQVKQNRLRGKTPPLGNQHPHAQPKQDTVTGSNAGTSAA